MPREVDLIKLKESLLNEIDRVLSGDEDRVQQHGTLNEWRHHDCRCDLCRAARYAYDQKEGSARRRRRKFEGCEDITEAACIALLAGQGNKCGICKKDLVWPNRDSTIDHDHSTGKIRGVLCRYCNLGIGNLQDDPELLRQAAVYLEESEGANQ